MSNFNFRDLIALPHCGKETRKYIYAMGVSAVVILASTYLYEFVYLDQTLATTTAGTRAVNQLQPARVAGQFASPTLGMNVAQPPAPLISANANIPGNHKRDGRDKAPCSSCHQIRGKGKWSTVAFMTPVNQDPRRLNGRMQNNNPGLNRERNREVNQNAGGRAVPFAQVVGNLRNSIVNITSVQTSVPTPKAKANLPGIGGTQFAEPLTGTSMESVGSGIIVSQNGHILTNHHVIRNATGVFVTVFSDAGQQRYSGEIIKMDEKLDLALIKIQPNAILQPAPLGNSDMVQVADSVIAIGSPFGLDQTVSRGIISGLRKSIRIEKVTHDRLIQTDAAINTGNSGGALVDRNGRVIGVNTAIYTPNGAFAGIGFAIPIKQAKAFMSDVVDMNGASIGLVNGKQGAMTGMGQNIAAVVAPPIRANSTPPGSHQDGRDQMACTTCHKVKGAGGQAAAFNNALPFGFPMGLNVAGQGGPRILAGTRSPHRDGREKMDCTICHQVVPVPGKPPAAKANPAAFMTAANGTTQFATAPMNVAAIAGINQAYFDGATLEPITPVIANRINTQVEDGAFVSSVYPNTAAARAGLHAGDIIFKINGRWVLSPQDLLQRVNEFQAGDNLRLGVYSGGQRRNLYLVLSGQTQSPQATVAPQGAQGQARATIKLPSEINWQGLELKPITPEVMAKDATLQGKNGTLVTDVDNNSIGELAGLRKGDIVKRLDGLPVNTIDTLDNVINKTSLAGGVLFLVERNGRNIYITMKQ